MSPPIFFLHILRQQFGSFPSNSPRVNRYRSVTESVDSENAKLAKKKRNETKPLVAAIFEPNRPLSRGGHFVSGDLKSFIFARLASFSLRVWPCILKQANKKAVPNVIRLECHNNDPVSNWPIDSECEYNKTGAEFLPSEHAIFPLLSLSMLTQNFNSK